MRRPDHILLIEDDRILGALLEDALDDADYQVTHVLRGEEGIQHAKEGTFDLVVTDVRLPDIDGLDVLQQIHEAKPLLPVIVMTSFASTDLAIEATLRGAFEYLVKPFDSSVLLEIAVKAIRSYRLSTKSISLPTESPESHSIIGQSPAMQELYKQIGRTANQNIPVLILGETGTGKELVARAIYRYSDRSSRPFVPINCAAIPETLLESELFGHEKGAFTGATSKRIGRFQQANGGTLFLDEIGELSLPTQAKLLRVLQDSEIQPLGSDHVEKVDVRIITATHRDLPKLAETGMFREDLLFRLNVVSLNIPSLDQRREDIADLIAHFVSLHAGDLGKPNLSISADAVQWLSQRSWPGNVRQLENTLRKAILRAPGNHIGIDHVNDLFLETIPHDTDLNSALDALIDEHIQLHIAAKRPMGPSLMQELEKKAIERTLERLQGKKAKTATVLGMSRQTLNDKIQLYGIHVEPRSPQKKETES